MWLGYEDSNLGMPESESGALPLGDTPTGCVHRGTSFEFGWGTRIRTSECRNQNPVPYRLAIPQQIGFEFAEHIRHIQNLVATTGFEPVTPSL